MKRAVVDKEALADTAYERGWVDSLDAFDRMSGQSMEDKYWYSVGWEACAKYRWKDPKGRGVAPDRKYRTPRQENPQ